MNRLDAARRDSPVERGGVAAPPGPDATMVDAPTVVVDADTGDPVVVVAPLDEADLTDLRRLLTGPAMRWEGLSSEGRMSGLRVPYRTFGFAPRSPLRRREACTATAISVERPDLAVELDRLAAVLDGHFAAAAPAQHAAHRDIAAAVHPDWRIGGTGWTSGIINRTSALTYHTDANNFRGAWSAMIVARHMVRGGHLHIPHYGLHITCSDSTAVFFNGADLLHGVTPFERRRPDAYRFTVVYYAVNNMRHCLPCADELAHGQRRRAARETVDTP